MAFVLRAIAEMEAEYPATSQPSERLARSQTEEQIESLVTDISRLIRSVAPQQRPELKEFAETLLREEIATIDEHKAEPGTEASRRRFSPLAPGVLLMFLGMGLVLIVPLVGGMIAFIGLIMAIWGVVLSFLRK
jgi:Flp pilus assembly protein TadB